MTGPKINQIFFDSVLLIQPEIFADQRGIFYEGYRQSYYRELGIQEEFVQDNCSFSKKGTIRGFHFQLDPPQSKLISVLDGEIYDVFVDIRPHSPTFGKWRGVNLDSKERKQLYLPSGFAHGFAALSGTATVLYKLSSAYNPQKERGFRFDDPELSIFWPVQDPILSARDLSAPKFREVVQ